MKQIHRNFRIEIETFDLIFNEFDQDKSGTVEKEEMLNFIKKFLGFDKE